MNKVDVPLNSTKSRVKNMKNILKSMNDYNRENNMNNLNKINYQKVRGFSTFDSKHDFE